MIAGFGEIAERLRRSTVHVGAGGGSSGSGVVWDHAGTVITNAHVARSPSARVTLFDGRSYPARVRLWDGQRDLAVLQIDARDLTPIEVADSSKLCPGEIVIAVGNPMGFTGALTTGVVHTVGPVAGVTRKPFVQASVRLAPGNSGGPLADSRGRLVGINTMVAFPGGGRGMAYSGGVNATMALAVPSNAVRAFLAQTPGTRKV